MSNFPATDSHEESLHLDALPSVGLRSHMRAEGPDSTNAEPDPLAAAIAQRVAVPVIVRVAGLPASTLDGLRSEATLAALADLERTRDGLSALQDQVRKNLYESLPRMPSDLRGRALGVQRACYNRRPIAGRDPRILERLQPWAGSALGELVHAEGLLQLQLQRYQTAYSEERDRVRRRLLTLAARPDMARALALSSRTLVGQIPRLERKVWSAYGRKERGAERSLVRYLSRVVVKLSPYSTFTKIGLGVIVPSASLGILTSEGAHDGIHLAPKPWSEGSLVRLKSYIPNQWMALLQRVPVIRRGLVIQWNGSLELLADGVCRFFRPLSLVWQPAEEEWQFVRASRITVRLSGAFHEWVVETLGTRRMTLAAAAHAAAETLGVAPEAAEAALGHYLDLGVLQAARPWPTYSAWPEQELAKFLHADELAEASELVEVREAVDQLVESERSFGEGSQPVETLERIEALARTVFDHARDVAGRSTEGLSDQLQMETTRQDVYEDVFERSLLPQGVMAGVDRAVAEEVLEAGDAFWQIRGLFSSRHEVRHTFWQEARRRWPGRQTVPCLEFFSGLEATAKQYAAYLVDRAERRLFNPLGLDEIEALGRLRSTVLQELDQALRSTEEGDRLALADARRIGALIPDRWRSLSGPCLPVQPTGPGAATWVTHHMTDGVGRLSSRFNSLLDENARRWFTEHWSGRSLHSTPVGEGELLDLLFTQLTTTGRHWPQTTAVLESLGETAETAEQQLVQPRDLEVAIGSDNGDLALLDRHGRRYFPAVLSAIHRAWIPTFFKFLVVLGHDPISHFDLPRSERSTSGVSRLPRLTVGRLVVRRQRWVISAQRLPALDPDEALAFDQLRAWRADHGLPERVFWIESISRKGSRPKTKPQWIDFRSPALVSLLAESMRDCKPEMPLVLEECLPEPEGFAVDPEGESWATEILLESLALADIHRAPISSHPVDGASTEGQTSKEQKTDDITQADELRIEARSDQELEAVGGGEIVDHRNHDDHQAGLSDSVAACLSTMECDSSRLNWGASCTPTIPKQLVEPTDRPAIQGSQSSQEQSNEE